MRNESRDDRKEGGRIYIDLYFFFVSFIDYQIIKIALILQKIQISWKRKFMAAMLGAALDSLFQVIKIYYMNHTRDLFKNNFIRKGCLLGVTLGIALIMTEILIRKRESIQKIKISICLFVSAWILGGSIQWLLSEKYQNKALFLCMISWLISFVMQRLIMLYQNAMQMESGIVQVCIVIKGQKYMLRGLFDTGNHLYEPYKHRPVHIIEAAVLTDVLKDKECTYMYIPYQSLGKEDGLLPAFCAEQLIIHKANQEIILKNQIIGLTELSLNSHKHYQMLLHPDVISFNKEEGKIVC